MISFQLDGLPELAQYVIAWVLMPPPGMGVNVWLGVWDRDYLNAEDISISSPASRAVGLTLLNRLLFAWVESTRPGLCQICCWMGSVMQRALSDSWCALPPFSFPGFHLWYLSILIVSNLRLLNFLIPSHLTIRDPALGRVRCNWVHQCSLMLLLYPGHNCQIVLSTIMPPSNSKSQFSHVLSMIWSSGT